MSLKFKADPIADFFKIAVDDTFSPSERSAAVAGFAREKITEAEEQNKRILGRIPSRKHWVDGRPEAPLESVNPDRGKIVVEFELIEDVLRWIGEELVQRSPYESGDYQKAHTLFVDGKEVEPGGQIPFGDEYVFTNMLPYSRKLEIGKTKTGRDFLVSVPNRIYERTAKDARARFGNVAKILFTYRGIVGRSSGAGTMVNPMKIPLVRKRNKRSGRFESMGGPKAWNKASNRFPVIVVRYGD